MENPKYENSKIYKITDLNDEMMYIGSTIQPLEKRLSMHKSHYRRYLKTQRNKLSSFEIFERYGLENCKIELIEEYPCESRRELSDREGEHIKENDCVNKNVAGRTSLEWYHDNKERLKEKRIKLEIEKIINDIVKKIVEHIKNN